MKIKVYIVIPNWNGEDLIAECLASLRLQSYPAKIIVVENGSIDGSIEIIESQFPDVILLKQPENLGFAGGVNVGIRYALEHGADAVALFNNDAVAEPDWLKNLVASLEDNGDIGIVTGKFMRTDKKHIDSTGDYYSVYGMPFPRDRNKPDTGQRNNPEHIFGASGGASLYRADMLKETGLFDEAFFAYYEDVDISFRAQLAGWKVAYEPTALAYHHVSGTSSKLGNFTRYHATKNFYLLYAKNMPGWLYWKYLPLFTLQSLRLAASSTIKGGLWPFIKGSAKAFWLSPHIIKERRNIQKSRKVSLIYINSILYKHRPPKIPKINS
jgi:GT2 family glycosyltransferase